MWSDCYYKSKKKLYEQIYDFCIQEYPAIKNDNCSIEESNVLSLLNDPYEVGKIYKL